jgi:hypothetical protein
MIAQAQALTMAVNSQQAVVVQKEDAMVITLLLVLNRSMSTTKVMWI